MDAKLKAQWLEALRSGKYEQGRGRLRASDNKYCCLGVLCDIMAPTDWVKPSTKAKSYMHDGEAGYLSTFMSSFAGLEDGVMHELAIMNDNGKGFEEIADHIEENL